MTIEIGKELFAGAFALFCVACMIYGKIREWLNKRRSESESAQHIQQHNEG